MPSERALDASQEIIYQVGGDIGERNEPSEIRDWAAEIIDRIADEKYALLVEATAKVMQDVDDAWIPERECLSNLREALAQVKGEKK